MAGQILRTPLANDDMLSIWEYIAADNEATADNFLRQIDQVFQRLVESPGIGRSQDQFTSGLRSFPIGRYVIFYQTIPNGIEIIRVLHGARQLEDFF